MKEAMKLTTSTDVKALLARELPRYAPRFFSALSAQ
jgi:hypothetical protein